MTELVRDPERDLVIERVIRAPRTAVWRAWTDPVLLGQWWVPAPYRARADRLEVQPGGAFVTSLSEDGVTFVPHSDATFLVVEPERRIVFTNTVTSSWHPAEPAPVAITAEITLAEHAEGTQYTAVVRHRDAADAARHAAMGFYEGWGAVTGALAELAETGDTSGPAC